LFKAKHALGLADSESKINDDEKML